MFLHTLFETDRHDLPAATPLDSGHQSSEIDPEDYHYLVDLETRNHIKEHTDNVLNRLYPALDTLTDPLVRNAAKQKLSDLQTRFKQSKKLLFNRFENGLKDVQDIIHEGMYMQFKRQIYPLFDSLEKQYEEKSGLKADSKIKRTLHDLYVRFESCKETSSIHRFGSETLESLEMISFMTTHPEFSRLLHKVVNQIYQTFDNTVSKDPLSGYLNDYNNLEYYTRHVTDDSYTALGRQALSIWYPRAAAISPNRVIGVSLEPKVVREFETLFAQIARLSLWDGRADPGETIFHIMKDNVPYDIQVNAAKSADVQVSNIRAGLLQTAANRGYLLADDDPVELNPYQIWVQAEPPLDPSHVETTTFSNVRERSVYHSLYALKVACWERMPRKGDAPVMAFQQIFKWPEVSGDEDAEELIFRTWTSAISTLSVNEDSGKVIRTDTFTSPSAGNCNWESPIIYTRWGTTFPQSKDAGYDWRGVYVGGE